MMMDLINLFEKSAMYFDSAVSRRAYFNMHCYDLPILIVDFHFFCANNQEFEIVLTLKICGFCLNGKILEPMQLVKV